MKICSLLSVLGLLSLALAGCNPASPQANTGAEDSARRQLEAAQAAYEKQAAEMEARSSRLAEDLAALQQSVRDKESAELNAKLDALRSENERLQADAEAARRRSDELGEQIAALPAPPLDDPNTEAADAEYTTNPAADYPTFYEELNPYGRWLEVEDYGYAWHPNAAERTVWLPYVDGRWAWSDQGWVWASNEPFGWACYHYGRWVHTARHGWVWVPGRQWAPAWVAWRKGGDYVGWAPLPPGRHRGLASIGRDCDTRFHLSASDYTFIRAENFGRPSYLNVCLPINTVSGLFSNTVNVTNIVQVEYRKNKIFVHRGGPDRDWVEGRFTGRLPRAEVQVAAHLDRSQMRRAPDCTSPDGTIHFAIGPISGRSGEHLGRPSMAGASNPAPTPESAERIRGGLNEWAPSHPQRESAKAALLPLPTDLANQRQEEFRQQQEATAQQSRREAEAAAMRGAALAQQRLQQQAAEQRQLMQAQREAEIARNQEAAATQQRRQAAFEANRAREAMLYERAHAPTQPVETQQPAVAIQQTFAVQARERMQRDQEDRARLQQTMTAQQQQEQTKAAAMRAQKEMVQHQADEDAARQNAMRRQQQQDAAQRAAQESARRATEEAARRSSEEAARQQRDNSKHQDDKHHPPR